MARGRGSTGRMAIGLDGTREAVWRVIRHQSSVDSSDSWRMESSYRLAELCPTPFRQELPVAGK
ncbi:hypothetical protein CFAM422_003274 [Trichoderma lentiforme]|uniref:Uncharacterized protein n=1 Tax=Trichoderma lentiforme TaxID=1567552 RepID=A0A9P5CHA4_9HYPO|nr:hypothetical protein CFAM422_003274 [Trichoderma lentiforme]